VRVVGSGGGYVGYVKEIDGSHLIVGRPARSDLFVPLGAGHLANMNRFVLRIPAYEVEREHGDRPASGGLQLWL
jgi:hypothetical protein